MIKIEWLLPGPSFSEREMGTAWLMGYIISVLQGEKVSKDLLHNNVNILSTTTDSQMVKMVNSMLIFKPQVLEITWENENIKCYFIKRDGEEKSHSHETKYMQYFILDMQEKLFENL